MLVRCLQTACLFSALVVVSAARAQASPDARTVSLRDVLERARDNPPLVLSALATLERVRAQEDLARSAYYPRLAASAQGGVSYDNRPVLPDNRVVRIDATALVGTGNVSFDLPLADGARGHSVEAARASTGAQRFSAQSTQRTAMQAALEIYLRGLSASALLADARLTLERRTHQLSSIAALVKAGVRPQVDAQRAEIEAVAARYALEMRSVEEQAAFAALAVAMGEDPNRPVQPLPLEHDPFDAPSSPSEATALAIEHRPEVKQLEATLAARQADDRAARSARWPTAGIAATGQLSYLDIVSGVGIDGTLYSGNAGLYLRWNALDASVWRRAQVTQKSLLEAQKQLEASLLQLRAEVVDAAYIVKRAKARLDQATQVLAAAQVTRDAQNERYRAGMASLLELLDAEAVEQSARFSRIEAERDYDVARVRLLSACGLIDRLLR